MQPKNTLLLILIFFSFLSKAQNEFITLWKPSNDYAIIANSEQISKNNQIFFPGIGTNYKIDWEEVGNPSHKGTLNDITSIFGKPILIDFGNALSDNPIYKVKVSNGTGIFERLAFQSLPSTMYSFGDVYKIIDVVQWGNINWKSMECAFYSCSNLDITAADIPDLSKVSNAGAMFSGCYKLKGNSTFNSWNTATITNMVAMFSGTGNFNQNIGNWNTSKVNNMHGMFFSSIFNQNIGNWNTSNVTSMATMFSGAENFNQNIGNWNTAKVTDMSYMFSSATNFNQNIGNWNTAKVTNMERMFRYTSQFNQNIGNWNTANVTNMAEMFSYAIAFNETIGNWNISKVTDMSRMFFRAFKFNQYIGNWNTSRVNDMSFMFQEANSFNQDIGNWNTAAVMDMTWMLIYAKNFNQNIGNWNLRGLWSGKDMLYLSGIDCTNYDKILIGWGNNPNTRGGIRLASKLIYSSPAAVEARTKLINKGWDLGNDIYNPNCSSLSILDSNEKKVIEIYPNPVSDDLHIKNGKENNLISIYDATGKLVKQEKLHHSNKISVKDFARGIYFIKIDHNQALKFLVE